MNTRIMSIVATSLLLSPDSAEGEIEGIEVITPNEAGTEVEDTRTDEEMLAAGELPEGYVINPDTNEPEKHLQDTKGNYYMQLPGRRLVIMELGGNNKGLVYYVKQFDSISAALELHSEAEILEALNASLLVGTRRMAKSTKIPTYEDDKANEKALAKLKEDSPIIFTQREADAFIPGSKPETFNSLMSMFRDAKKNKDKSKMRELLLRIQEIEGIDDEDEDED